MEAVMHDLSDLQIRTREVCVPVPVTVIAGSQLRETRGACLLTDEVIEVLSAVADKPGFIGFKAPKTWDVENILHGPYSHLLFDNVTRQGVAEVGIFGQVQGPLINWDRRVYITDEESGLLVPAFQVPFDAELWVCGYVRENTCGSLAHEFYTPLDDEPVD
jgi:hypothetical protein